jgi:hypothetical protein
MKNRLHELDLGTGGGGDWNSGDGNNGNNGGNDWNTGDGNDGGNKTQKPGDGNKTKPRRKGSNNTVCINKVQNLLKELNPAFNVSGSMDNNTLIEIMNKLNELEKSLTVTKDEVAVIEKPKFLPSIDITEL